jgi:hypothetical protein
MEGKTGYIRVINNNERSIMGRYAGVDYHFKPGNPVDVPEIVAAHVFGFGKEDKTQALARLGWMRTSDELEFGLEKLSKVSFDDPPEMIEAPVQPKRKKLTSPAGPPVEAGGTEGGGFKSPPTGLRVGENESAPDEDADSEF